MSHSARLMLGLAVILVPIALAGAGMGTAEAAEYAAGDTTTTSEPTPWTVSSDRPLATTAQTSRPTVSIETESVRETGAVRLNLTLSGAPVGISGYVLEARVTDSSTATITNASTSFPSGGANASALSRTEIDAANGTVSLSAADLNDEVSSGATDVSLGLIELTGAQNGSTVIEVTALRVDDDEGGPVNATATDGSVTVIGALCAECEPPRDLDGDGKYEDINGNGVVGFGDIVVLFENLTADRVVGNAPAIDYNENGVVGFGDVVSLFRAI